MVIYDPKNIISTFQITRAPSTVPRPRCGVDLLMTSSF